MSVCVAVIFLRLPFYTRIIYLRVSYYSTNNCTNLGFHITVYMYIHQQLKLHISEQLSGTSLLGHTALTIDVQ